jgi:uncharacterized protein (UPF0303 family)
MVYTDEFIKELEKQEEELQFSQFTNSMALEIGLMITEKAKADGLAITIDITRNGHQLFHYALEGTGPDNDQWIIRKNRVVNRFNKSSLLVGASLRNSGKTLEDTWFISSFEYAANGGAFPIRIKNVGVVGTITVSGLAQEQDHALVVTVLRKYLGQC